VVLVVVLRDKLKILFKPYVTLAVLAAEVQYVLYGLVRLDRFHQPVQRI
jgi:hypothetical protein